MPATYEPIATTTLGSGAANITFSSISASYTDLVLVIVPTTSGGGTTRIRFNSDSGTNYSLTRINGNGTTATSLRTTSGTEIALSATFTSIPVSQVVNIFSYAGSTNKTILGSFAADNNGSGDVRNIVGLWRNTAAITSIEITPNSGTLSTGTTATLYGILKA